MTLLAGAQPRQGDPEVIHGRGQQGTVDPLPSRSEDEAGTRTAEVHQGGEPESLANNNIKEL